MTTHCRFCGEPVRPNTMFCPSCGQIIGGDAPAFRAGQAPPPFHTTGSGSVVAATESVPPPRPLPPVPLPAAPARARADEAAGGPAPRGRAVPETPAGGIRRGSPPVLRLPGGAELPVDRTYVLGRSPGSAAADHGGDPVEIPDPHRSMSRVHLVVAPGDAGGVRVRDPGSANGTVVQRGGSRRSLAPGEPFEAQPGDRILLGDVAIDVV